MGVLGKDLFDIHRSITHTKIQFGEKAYWVEDNPKPIPYGTVLVDVLNFDVLRYKKSLPQNRETNNPSKLRKALGGVPLYRYYASEKGAFAKDPKLDFYISLAEDIEFIQERYVWFLKAIFEKVEPEKKKGQRKLTPAELISNSAVGAFVSGVSLGENRNVDAPQVNVQYAMLNALDDSLPAEIVEKMYFDRLLDFVYVEFMKGMQKGFIPKRCPNCGRWFLQEPGQTYAYCSRPIQGELNKTCRDVGSVNSFQTKAHNNDIWKYHQRAYKKYFARIKAGTMKRGEFTDWADKAEKIRDKALAEYKRVRTEDERKAIAERFKAEVNFVE